jgi:hypothetical protein
MVHYIYIYTCTSATRGENSMEHTIVCYTCSLAPYHHLPRITRIDSQCNQSPGYSKLHGTYPYQNTNDREQEGQAET